ncbi:MAG: alanine racemase [Lachnospiraceae bacterium]
MEPNQWREIAKQYGTPSYVFDLDVLEKRLKMMKEILGPQVHLCYAMKANPFLVKPMDTLVERFEVCSPGEFCICEQNQISMEKIVLSGVYKEKKDILRAMHTYGGKGIFTIESQNHLDILSACAKETGNVITALIRVTSGNQFGVVPEEVCRMVAERANYPEIHLAGLQYYSGTQKKKLSKIEKELITLDTLLETLQAQYGFQAEELEYGPGFYVPYFQKEEPMDDEKLLTAFSKLLEQMKFRGRITLEMGRYMVAECGYYLTSIVDQKKNQGENYCIMDGGIHHLNYYGQTMAMKIPMYEHIREEEKTSIDRNEEAISEWNICGALCTVSDVIVKHLPLQNPKVNDILVFQRVGAYSVTEGIYLFLSRDLPNVLFYKHPQGIQPMRKRQPTHVLNSI